MAHPAPTVPYDIWLCGRCNGANLIANAPSLCPACGHPRDYEIRCCTNPGEQIRTTGLFPNHPQYRHTDEGGPLYVDAAAGDARVSGRAGYAYGFDMVESPVNVPHGFVDPRCYSYSYNASQPKFDAFQAFASSDALCPHEAFISCGAAGSQADGSWICDQCGCANSILCDSCMACYVPK